MADPHDDRTDSALDLLRSRQWAGPATNPVLEKQFMQPIQETRGLNLRLVLGIAGALIGCGAVAAATRPAWRAAIFGAPQRAPSVAASSEPASTAPAAGGPASPQRSLAVRSAVPPPPPAEAPEANPDPGPSLAAAPGSATMDEPVPDSEVTSVETDENEWLRTADPECYYQRALAAYLDRYVAGDAQGCAAIARAVDGTSNVLAWQISDELSRLIAFKTLTDGPSLGVVHLNLAIHATGSNEGEGAGQTLELDMSPDGLSTDGVFMLDSVSGSLHIEGSAGRGDGQSVMVIRVPASASTPAVPASPASPR